MWVWYYKLSPLYPSLNLIRWWLTPVNIQTLDIPQTLGVINIDNTHIYIYTYIYNIIKGSVEVYTSVARSFTAQKSYSKEVSQQRSLARKLRFHKLKLQFLREVLHESFVSTTSAFYFWGRSRTKCVFERERGCRSCCIYEIHNPATLAGLCHALRNLRSEGGGNAGMQCQPSG